jgi:hypothetical protein
MLTIGLMNDGGCGWGLRAPRIQTGLVNDVEFAHEGSALGA